MLRRVFTEWAAGSASHVFLARGKHSTILGEHDSRGCAVCVCKPYRHSPAPIQAEDVQAMGGWVQGEQGFVLGGCHLRISCGMHREARGWGGLEKG
jgi:hypothetical protein